MLREMRFVPRIIILLVGATAAFVFLTSGDEDSHGRRLTTFASDPKTVSRKSMSIRNDLEFVHITKTGGTAIEQAAAKAGIHWGVCHFVALEKLGCAAPDWKYAKSIRENGLRQKYHGEEWHAPPTWMNPNPYDKAAIFTVVRDPYDRVMSEYRLLSREAHDDPLAVRKWISDKLTSVVAFKHYPGHFLPQHFYVFGPDGSQIINHIIRYENLSEEFPKLMAEYKLNIMLPPKLTWIAPTRNTKWRKWHLSPEVIAQINDVYRLDFEKLGYKMVTSPDEFVDKR